MSRVGEARTVLTDAYLDRLARLWKEGVPTSEIATRCGTTACAVHGLAHRFRDRFPKRGYTTSDRKPTNHKWGDHHSSLEMVRRCEEMEKTMPPGGPVPTVYRCGNCGGRCDSPRGHPGCRSP